MSDAESGHSLDESWCGDCPFRELPSYDGLAPHDLTLLQTRTVELAAPPGTLLCREGDPACGVYFLATGWVLRSHLLPNGRNIILQLHFPGDLIGHAAAFLGAPPHYSAAALTAITYRVLDRERIAAAFTTAPELARRLALRLARRNRVVDFRLMNLARGTSDERLATMLLYIFARLRRLGLLKDDTFTLPLSNAQIADVIGTHAVHISRILRRLRGAGDHPEPASAHP